jgi:hypothetical protein
VLRCTRNFAQLTTDNFGAFPYSPVVRIAFKEWAVVVDALGRGEQIIILRKGGIDEGRGGFQVEHDRFLLFPTLFHQQRESVLPAAQARYDAIAPGLSAELLRLELFAEVADWKFLDSFEAAQQLRGQHVWRDEVIRDRFDWGKSKSIYAMAVRVYQLPLPVELPMRAEYGGCKSWVDLDCDISTEGAQPALADVVFQQKLDSFRVALNCQEPASGTLAAR